MLNLQSILRALWQCIPFRVLFGVSVVGLTVGSLLPDDTAAGVTVSDKLIHFAAYGLVGVMAILSFSSPQARLGAILSLLGLGLVLEIGQIIVPGRFFEWYDLVANAAGLLSALCIGLAGTYLARRLAARQPNHLSP